MAQYDSVDLLARTKRMARRPTVDEENTDANWYERLEEAQTYWLGQLAAQVPELNYGAPELMTSADGGKTYTLGTEPLGGHLEIRATRNGILLIEGPEWSETADYCWEGSKTIRIPNNRSRTFGDGPYARYVKTPGLLSAAVQPVLQPPSARLLLPPRACVIWALEGPVVRDPSSFLKTEQMMWSGDPDKPGDTGILGVLKTRAFTAGMAAVARGDEPWYRNPDMR